jgi:hypothetical protein
MSFGSFSSKLGPLIAEHQAVITNLEVGMEHSKTTGLDLEKAYATVDLETPPEIQELEDTIKSYFVKIKELKIQELVLEELRIESIRSLPLQQEIISTFQKRVSKHLKPF